MKRLFVAMLIFCLLLAPASMVSGSEASGELEQALQEGFITQQQYDNRGDIITREAFCNIVAALCEKKGTPLPEAELRFTDTDNKNVAALNALGIINGDSETRFSPDRGLTRQELCAILVRLIDVTVEGADITLHADYVFDDDSYIAYWAEKAVDYLYYHRIVKGISDYVISPKASVTVEQASYTALRIYEKQAELIERAEPLEMNEFEWAIKPVYDGIVPQTTFACQRAAVSKDGKWGYIDRTGKEVISLKYDMAYPFSDGFGRVELDGKIGYVNKTGDLVIPCEYEEGGDFKEGMVWLKKDGKYGFADTNGNIAIPFMYDYAYEFNGGVAPVKKDGVYGYVDAANNTVIDFKFYWASAFSEDRARVMEEGHMGYIDHLGNIVIPCQYDYAFDYSEDYAVVYDMDRYSFINKSGELMVPFETYRPLNCMSDGLMTAHKHTVWEGVYGFVGADGQWVIKDSEHPFHQAGDFNEGLASVSYHSNRTDRNYRAFINKEGKCVLPYKENLTVPNEIEDNFFYMSPFSEGMAALVTEEGKLGFVRNPLLIQE